MIFYMKKLYRKIRDVWNESSNLLHEKPEIWISEATNLKNTAELLYEHEKLQMTNSSSLPDKLKTGAFFRGRIIRMMIGFSIENLLKGLIFQIEEEREKVLRKDGNIRWDAKKSHDLIYLSNLSSTSFDEEEKKKLELWQVCAVWAGRYPIPKNENELPNRREPAKSSEELLKRRHKEISKLIREGKNLEPELIDLLHTSIGDSEFKCFVEIFDRLKKSLDKARR